MLKPFVRGILLAAFSLLFCVLASVLIAHAETIEDSHLLETRAQWKIKPSSEYFQTAAFGATSKVEFAPATKPPWYLEKRSQIRSIFEAGEMTSQWKQWDPLARDLFVQDLDFKGARAVASLPQYKNLSEGQLKKAEKRLRQVKEGRR